MYVYQTLHSSKCVSSKSSLPHLFFSNHRRQICSSQIILKIHFSSEISKFCFSHARIRSFSFVRSFFSLHFYINNAFSNPWKVEVRLGFVMSLSPGITLPYIATDDGRRTQEEIQANLTFGTETNSNQDWNQIRESPLWKVVCCVNKWFVMCKMRLGPPCVCACLGSVCLWTKGRSHKHFLNVIQLHMGCKPNSN